MECPICSYDYTDGGEYDPRSLPCGHTLCITCLHQLRANKCPICSQHFSRDINKIPRNFTVIDFCRHTSLSTNHKRSLSETINFEHIQSKIAINVSKKEDILTRIRKIRHNSQVIKQQIQDTQERLNELQSNSSCLDLEYERLCSKKEQIQSRIIQLQNQMTVNDRQQHALPAPSFTGDGTSASSGYNHDRYSDETTDTTTRADDEITRSIALLREGSAKDKIKAAEVLYELAANADNSIRIGREGGISALIALLREGSTEGKSKAAAVLRKLAAKANNSISIAREDGISALIALLREGREEGKIEVAAVLDKLAANADNSISIGRGGNISALIASLREGSAEGMGT